MTSFLVTIALMGFVVAMLLYGGEWLGLDKDKLDEIMGRIADTPFAIIGVICVFAVLALTGFPQTLLIAGTVAVFGAQVGSSYAWIATMISATLTFALGHMFGGRAVRRLSAGRAVTMIETVQRHGILTTMMVRWTPSAPFIVVNAIAGAAHISILKFWLGTGIGIIPKILFIAYFSEQVDDVMKFFTSRDPKHLIAIGALLGGWIAFLLLMRWLFRKLRLGG
ncbi:MAG: VTT domain-containing protein [Parvularculaceae bacterium]